MKLAMLIAGLTILTAAGLALDAGVEQVWGQSVLAQRAAAQCVEDGVVPCQLSCVLRARPNEICQM